jgi:hypothetical protein
MSSTQLNKIELEQLVTASTKDYEDNTDTIRRLKHSQIIANDVNTVLSSIMAADIHNKMFTANTLPENAPIQEYLTDELLYEKCAAACPFLYEHYLDIFKRLMRKELNVGMFFQVLNVLSDIEDGNIDQESGSVKVGKLLYNLYVDSRERQTTAAELLSVPESTKSELEFEQMADAENRMRMTWRQYKKTQP